MNPDNPQTSVIVNIEDDKNPCTIYRISVVKGAEVVKVENTEKRSFVLTDLEPTEKYDISVETFFEGMESGEMYLSGSVEMGKFT